MFQFHTMVASFVKPEIWQTYCYCCNIPF